MTPLTRYPGHPYNQSRVREGHSGAFEEHYGPSGTWVRLFRKGRGFRRTMLLRDRSTPGRYMTIDVWDSLRSYRSFLRRHAGAYRALDRLCHALTRRERRVGRFEAP